MSFRAILLSFLLLWAPSQGGGAAMCLASGGDEAPGFPQSPSISPDGRTVVFSWAGDLWAVDRGGGIASRLSAHPGEEGRSAFSPDGSLLAFESDREGARNLYTARLQRDAGALVARDIRRVTVSDRPQTLAGFSADGSELYFSASRDPEIYRHARMYRAPIGGGPVRELSGAFGFAPNAAPDGASIVFTRGYASIWNRPRYRGPGGMDVWRHDLRAGSFERITHHAGNDGDAFAMGDGSIVFVSSRDGQNNIYRLAPGAIDRGQDDSPVLKKLTSFAPSDARDTIAHGVRDLYVCARAEMAIFCVWDTIYTLDLGDPGASPVALEVVVASDAGGERVRRVDLGSFAGEMAMTADAKALAVAARGEILVRSADEGAPTRRVTNTPGREVDVVFSPDAQYLYFASDASGNWDIHRARVTMTRGEVRKSPFDDAPEKKSEASAGEPSAGASPAGGSRDPVSGEWECVLSGANVPQGVTGFSLSLRLVDGQVEGRLVVPGMIEAPVSGVYDASGGVASLTVSVEGQSASLQLRIRDGQLEGKVTFAGAVIDVRGTRRGGGAQGAPAAGVRAMGDTPEQDAKEEDDEKKDGAKKEKVKHSERWADALRFEIEALVTGEANDRSPNPSPDGRRLAFVRGRGDLMLLDLVSGEQRVVLEGWDEPEVIWASDSRHIVFARTDLDFNRDIWLLDVSDAGGVPVNLTRHPDLDTSPRLSADGRILAFLSDRAGENFDFDVWYVFLDKTLEGLSDLEREAYFKHAQGDASKRGVIDPIDPESPAQGGEPLHFDDAGFDASDAYLRVRRVTSLAGSEGSLEITPAGDRVLFSASIDGSLALRSSDLRGQDRKTVYAGAVTGLRMLPSGSKATFVSGSVARSVPPGGGSAASYPLDAPAVIDIASEQRQKFIEAMRILGEGFYHPTLKDLDWARLTRRYLQLAMRTRTSAEFNRVANLMLGELDGSHLGVSGGDAFSPPSESIGYLAIDADPAPGGYVVRRVLRGSPAESPLARIEVGDTIAAIDGRSLSLSEREMPRIDLREALRGTLGRETLIDLRGADGESRSILIEPISYGGYSQLAYEQEVLDRRALVERLSEGRLGYLHIRGMSEPSVRDFERDLYAAGEGKQGLIIDVRDNGGGSTADILLSSLTAPRHAVAVPRGASVRDAFPDSYPRDRRLIHAYQRPISVLINQHSFSNAEIFAHAIKTIGRGRLVGTQTFGGVISTGGATLIDGTRVRTPFRGWYLPDGTDMENHGAVPDIDVPQTPADEAASRDPQIEAAVKELLERVAQSPDGLWHPGR